jgi:hemoglobin-like flavoprotein
MTTKTRNKYGSLQSSAGDFMNSEQINLLRTSFQKIEPVAEEAGVLFYVKLFKIDPELRRLFKGKMNEQGLKLMQMIGLAVEGLDRMEEFVPELRALGARHTGYGVEDRHYETVGAALLWTLEAALGADFNEQTKEAWTEVYSFLTRIMKEASRQTEGNATAV